MGDGGGDTATVAPPGSGAGADARADPGSLLTAATRALTVDGDLRASRDLFDAAYLAAEDAGDAPSAARAALGLGGVWVHEHRSVAAAALVQSRLRRALAVVDPRSPLHLRLRARLAAEADYRAGDHRHILSVLEEARGAGDDGEYAVAHAEAVSLAHHCVLGPGHGPLRRALAEELIALSVRTGRRSDLLLGVLWRTVDLFLDADPHAGRCLADLRDLLAQGDHLAVGFVARAMGVMLDVRAGRLDRAEAQAAACAAAGRAAGDVDATGWYGGQLVAVRWYQGRIAQLLPTLRELVNSPTLSAVDNSAVAALAVAAATAGDHREAAGALARLRGDDLARLPRASTWLTSMYGIVESAHLLGDGDASAAAYDLLLPYARLPMVGSLGVACFGSVQHALGVAALTAGDPDRAVGHLRAAVRDNLALRHWPAAAMSRARLAGALALRAGPGDADEAGRERDLAAREAAGLGMAWADEWRRTGGDAGGDPRPAAVSCQRRGGQWAVELAGRTVLIQHSVGMGYLATLLANPGREIPAVDLAAGSGGAGRGADGSAQPVLDEVARRAYRSRLSRLSAEIEEYGTGGDPRAERARAERDWLVDELRAAAGLDGRVRQFATADERARIAVGKAIRRALDRIAAADPAIGARLRAEVQTGLRCCYRPA